MKICEDCMKRDVCKFKEEVEKYEGDKLPEPLMPTIACKYKETIDETSYIRHYAPCLYCTIPNISIPSVWTEPTTTDPLWTTTWGNTSTDYIATS